MINKWQWNFILKYIEWLKNGIDLSGYIQWNKWKLKAIIFVVRIIISLGIK